MAPDLVLRSAGYDYDFEIFRRKKPVPVVTGRKPVCPRCGRSIRPCAPSCPRPVGVHLATGRHECATEGSTDGQA